jgi:hypothetical protein
MILVLLVTVFGKTTSAQLPIDTQNQSFDWLHQTIGDRSTIEMSIANEKMVRYRAMLLQHKMTAFVKAWNQLAEVTNNGGWDARLAKKAGDAFHELEKCEGWYVAKSNTSRP